MKKYLNIKNQTETAQYMIIIDKDSLDAIVSPPNILIQDSVEEMLTDIGKYDEKYLKELIYTNRSFYPGGVI